MLKWLPKNNVIICKFFAWHVRIIYFIHKTYYLYGLTSSWSFAVNDLANVCNIQWILLFIRLQTILCSCCSGAICTKEVCQYLGLVCWSSLPLTVSSFLLCLRSDGQVFAHAPIIYPISPMLLWLVVDVLMTCMHIYVWQHNVYTFYLENMMQILTPYVVPGTTAKKMHIGPSTDSGCACCITVSHHCHGHVLYYVAFTD